MAIDFDAIRKKVAELSGTQRRRSTFFWRPDVGEYTVRLLPFENNDGQPFKERWFYYNIGNNPGILSPRQFGNPDPIQDLIDKLRSDATPADFEMAKKLYPKMRAFAPVLVRGHEDQGVKLWSFGKMVYQAILNIMLDPDYGDITDPLEGRDIKVTISKPAGRQWAQTDVMPRGRASKLSDAVDQAQEWLGSVPDLDEAYQLKSYEEIEKIVNDWIAGESSSDGDDHFRAKTSTSTETTSTTASDKTYTDIDSAFADLLED